MTIAQFGMMLIVMGLGVSVTMDIWDFIHSDDRSKQTPALLRKLRRKIFG